VDYVILADGSERLATSLDLSDVVVRTSARDLTTLQTYVATQEQIAQFYETMTHQVADSPAPMVPQTRTDMVKTVLNIDDATTYQTGLSNYREFTKKMHTDSWGRKEVVDIEILGQTHRLTKSEADAIMATVNHEWTSIKLSLMK
jgi:hypothetical protein